MDKDDNLTDKEKKQMAKLQKAYLRRFAPRYYSPSGKKISKQAWDKLQNRFTKRGY